MNNTMSVWNHDRWAISIAGLAFHLWKISIDAAGIETTAVYVLVIAISSDPSMKTAAARMAADTEDSRAVIGIVAYGTNENRNEPKLLYTN